MWPIRTALSGQFASPGGATELADLLGKDETLRRLKIGLEKLQL
jgi:glutamyl-tRNA synthetase